MLESQEKANTKACLCQLNVHACALLEHFACPEGWTYIALKGCTVAFLGKCSRNLKCKS